MKGEDFCSVLGRRALFDRSPDFHSPRAKWIHTLMQYQTVHMIPRAEPEGAKHSSLLL